MINFMTLVWHTPDKVWEFTRIISIYNSFIVWRLEAALSSFNAAPWDTANPWTQISDASTRQGFSTFFRYGCHGDDRQSPLGSFKDR